MAHYRIVSRNINKTNYYVMQKVFLWWWKDTKFKLEVTPENLDYVIRYVWGRVFL